MSRIVDELRDHLEIATTNAGRQGIKLLLLAVAEQDSTLARASSDILTGLGTGLTPEGDDLLAAAAVATRALSPAVGFSFPESWVSSLIPDDHARRTNLISSCLLNLSAGGFSFEPVVSILNPRIGGLDLRSAVGRLLRLGHSTGYAYAVCIALTALVLGQTGDRNGEVEIDK